MIETQSLEVALMQLEVMAREFMAWDYEAEPTWTAIDRRLAELGLPPDHITRQFSRAGLAVEWHLKRAKEQSDE